MSGFGEPVGDRARTGQGEERGAHGRDGFFGEVALEEDTGGLEFPRCIFTQFCEPPTVGAGKGRGAAVWGGMEVPGGANSVPDETGLGEADERLLRRTVDDFEVDGRERVTDTGAEKTIVFSL